MPFPSPLVPPCWLAGWLAGLPPRGHHHQPATPSLRTGSSRPVEEDIVSRPKRSHDPDRHIRSSRRQPRQHNSKQHSHSSLLYTHTQSHPIVVPAPVTKRRLTQRARSDMYSSTIRLVRLRPPRSRHREPPQPAIDLPSPRHDTDTVSSVSINHQKHEYFRSVRLLLLLLLLLAIYRNGFSLYRNVSARTSKGSHPAAQRGRWACALERVEDFQQPALSLPSITQSARATRGWGGRVGRHERQYICDESIKISDKKDKT